MSVFLQPIFTQTVGAGGAASITFNNIPQGFTDLKFVISARSNQTLANGGYAAILRPNGATTNATGTQLYGDSTAIGSNRWLDAAYFNITPSDFTANTFSNSEIYVTNYAGGNYKSITADYVIENNAVGAPFGFSSDLYRNTTPITSFTFVPFAGNFVQYSTFTLYGVSAFYDTQVPTAPTLGTITDQAGFFSVAFTPAANDQAESYYAYSPASPTSPVYGAVSPIVIPVESQYNYNASIWVAAVNSLGVTQSATTSTGNVTNNNYASIATVPFTNSTTASAYFSSIPQNYKHLQLRCFVRMVSSQSTPYDLTVTVNGSNAASYSYHTLRGDGANSGSTGLANDNVLRFPVSVPNAFMTSNVFGVLIIDLPDYAVNTKFKTVRSLWGYDNNSGSSPTAGWVGNTGSSYQSFEPITSLIVASFGNFAQYSHIALYGIS
jgi:hypothetical protein